MQGVTPNPEDFVITLEKLRDATVFRCSRAYCYSRGAEAEAVWLLKVPHCGSYRVKARFSKSHVCRACAARAFWNAMDRKQSVRVLDETGGFVQNVIEIFDRRRARGIEATDP